MPDTQALQRSALHAELIKKLEAARPPVLTRETLQPFAQEIVHTFAGADANEKELVEWLLNRVVGFGPITRLLGDPDITEIMVNGPDAIFIEREGKLEQVHDHFTSDEELLQVISRIAASVGRRIDTTSPLVDARLPDGSRVNAIIPPLTLVGPCLTIRRFSPHPPGLNDLVARGSMSEDMGQFLRACITARINIVVSGGTGSGKTTTLNALASEISPGERLITIEDSAELRIRHPHVVGLEARTPNIEGSGAVTVRALVKNALRMRPDRILVGEIRSGEALDMLQAMNTGHQGSLTTVHANAPLEALFRIETMALMADVELPLFAIRQQIIQAVHIVVQQSRLPDGSRKIVCIAAQNTRQGASEYSLVPLFMFDKSSKHFIVTGQELPFEYLFTQAGVALPFNLQQR